MRSKALVTRSIIPGMMWRVRAWGYLVFLIATAAITSFALGNGNAGQAQLASIVGLVGIFIGAVNTPYELPTQAGGLVPWFTSERCFWLYRGIALLGTILAGLGCGSGDQWASFTTALATIFGLTVTTLRTSLVKAVNAPEVT